MAERIQYTQHDTTQAHEEAEELAASDTVNPEIRAKAEKMLSDIDAILDDISGILEENAQEFVANYIQKGGE